MRLENIIEAMLLFKAEPVTKKYLADLTEKSEEEINSVIESLKNELSERGIVVIEEGGKVCLGTNPLVAGFIKRAVEDELNTTPTKVTLETLAIIIYKGPLTKGDIDYIRGVNSNFILRNLLVKGLIEKSPNPKDKRTFLYKPTFDLLSYLGVREKSELPEYSELKEQMNKIVEQKEQEENEL